MIATNSKQNKKADQPGNIQVDHAKYLDGYTLAITFSDGKEKIVDFSDFLSKYANGYIAKYKNKSNFRRFKINRQCSLGERMGFNIPCSSTIRWKN